MAKVQDFPVGLVAPTGSPRLYCHIEVVGMGLFLGDLGPDRNYLLVEEARAAEFSYPQAQGLCPEWIYGGHMVRFQLCRRADQL